MNATPDTSQQTHTHKFNEGDRLTKGDTLRGQRVAVEARVVTVQWSPVQTASEVSISHERIYQHIATDHQRGDKLWQHLRCRKPRRRCGTPRQRQRFHGGPVAERPAIVATRQRVGDWKGDTIVGKGLARVVTLVDRKVDLRRMRRVPNGEADTFMRAIAHALHSLRTRIHTLTWDNGSEIAEHVLVDIASKARSYFAEPYSSWQRGTNENLNGLIRQYLPKRCDLSTYSDAEIQAIEDKLNRRPRKRIDFRTPQHVFEVSFNRGALRSSIPPHTVAIVRRVCLMGLPLFLELHRPDVVQGGVWTGRVVPKQPSDRFVLGVSSGQEARAARPFRRPSS